MHNENPISFIRENVLLDYAKVTELIVKDLNKSNNPTTKKFTRDNIVTYLANPIRYAKELQVLSSSLYNASSHYRRLINYFAKMPTLDYYIEPYGIDTSKSVNTKSLRNSYNKALDIVELMNLRHEFGKALVTAWKVGTFYGFEIYTKDSYFIMELPYDFCQISGIADGVYTFSFDVSYFDKNPNQLVLYPKEFQKMYKSFKGGSKPKWQEVDPSKSICIKVNDETYNDFPPFAGLFTDIFDIEDYKSLRKVNEVLGNYKFIVEKIPMREKSDKNNDFLVDLKTVAMFHNKTANLLPDEIGIFSTPFDVDTVEFSKTNSDKDAVGDAEHSFYSASGTSQLLFNGSKASQANLAKSINVDEAEVFSVLRQLERIVTLKIKNEVKGTFNFRLRFLNNTIFNKNENTETLLKNAQFGLPVKMMLCASLGLSPSALISMSYLENEVLGLADSFIPLASSHTQSKDNIDAGGRPQSNEDQLSNKGEEQRDRADNENRA
ncbi:hypothetical protein ABE137_12640 [Brevibacillus laterosporus]